jgi:hypothetical protein
VKRVVARELANLLAFGELFQADVALGATVVVAPGTRAKKRRRGGFFLEFWWHWN